MGPGEYLIPIRLLLESNIGEFRATFQRELRAMESTIATQARTGPKGQTRSAANAASSAQGQLASLAGRAEQQIETLRPQLGNDLTEKAIQSVRSMILQAHQGIEQALRASYNDKTLRVPLPTENQIRREAGRTGSVSAADEAAARELAAHATRRAQSEALTQASTAVGGRTLSWGGVTAYRDLMASREGTDLAKRAGVTGALDTQLGRVTSIFQELEMARPEVQEQLVTLRATASSLQKYRQTIENAAIEQAISNRLLSGESDDLADATGDLARVRRQRQLIEQNLGLTATEPLIGQEGATAARERERRLAVERSRIEQTTDGQRSAEAATVLAREREAAQIGAATARSATYDKELQEAKAREILARQQAVRAVNEQAQAMRRQDIAGGAQPQGTWFQRAQLWMAQRQGGPARSAQDYQQFGQFLGSRALTTAGFAASGALLYGGVSFAGDVLKESEQLQQQMSIIKAQFDTVQQSGDKISFEKFRKELQGVAIDSNTAADEVAFVTRQLAGAFADQEGRPNYSRGLDEARVSLGYSKLSGFPTQEINDSLTSIALAFRDTNTDEALPFTRILDQATYLEDKLGVLSQETIKFVADIAPLGKELGFTYEQLAGIGAVAQQSSGRTGAALAEQFGRILPFIQQNKADILGLFGQKAETQPAIAPLAKGFADGNISAVLAEIIRYYDELDATQKNVLGDMLGGQRNAAALFAVLNRAPQALKALEEGPQGDGSFERRMDEYRKTVAYSFELMRREAEKLGNTLYNAGLAEGLRDIAIAGQGLFRVVNLLVTGFGQLNQLAGGFPGRAAVVLATLKAMQKLMQAVAGTNLAKTFAGRIGVSLGSVPADALISQIPAAGFPAGFNRLGYAAAGANPGQFGSPYAASGRRRFGVALLEGISGLPGRFTNGQAPPLNTGLTKVTPAQAAASGGLLTAGATTAGLGTAVAGSLATAGVAVGALIVAQQLQSFYARQAAIKKETRDATEAALAAMEAAVEQGLSTDELIKVFDKSVEDTSLRRGSKGDPRLGGKSKRDKAYTELYNRATAKARKDLYQDQLETIKATLDEDKEGSRAALRGIFDRRDGASLSDLDQESALGKLLLDSKAGYEGSYGQVEYRDSTDLVDVVEKVRKYLLDNPDDPTARQGVEQLIKAVSESQGPDSPAARALRALRADFEKDQGSRRRRSSAADAIADLEATEQDYQAYLDNFRYEIEFSGTATTADLIASLDKKKRGIEAALTRSRGKLNPVQIAQLKKKVYEYRDMQRQAALAQIDFQDQTSTVFDDFAGDSPFSSAERKLDAAKARFAAVVASPDLGYRDRADAAVKLILAQRDAFAAQIEAASPAEALRLLSEGFKIDPSARKNVLSALIRDNAAVQGYINNQTGPINGQSEGAVRGDLINEAIKLVDEYGAKQVLAWLEAELARTDKTITDFAGAAPRANPEYTKLEALIAAIKADPTGEGRLGDENTEARKKLDLMKAWDDANSALRKSQLNGDPIAQAKEDVRSAENYVNLLRALMPNDTNAINQALAALNNSKYQLAEAIRDDAIALQRARANGDPLALAKIDLANARTPAERAEAENAVNDALDEISAAKGDYQAELLAGDPVAQARQQLANAERSVSTAKGAAAQWRALAQKLQAQRALRAAILDSFIAQKEVAIAVAEGAGQTVKAALIQLQVAQQRFNEAKANGVKGAELDRLRAEVIRQQTNVTNTQRSDRLGDLEYLYEFDKLTATAYIALLREELKKIPESNKEARRGIERRIQALRDEMSADLTTNLPSQIKLPILYEARRLNQIAQISNSSASYQDNRIGSIQIIIPGTNDAAATAQAIVDALDAATRSSLTGTPPLLVGIGG